MLKKGSLYRFNYQNYQTDRYPLALILYSDKTYTHAINFNYLSQAAREQVIDMVSMLATNKLYVNRSLIPGDDTYQLYHRYIKYKLPRIIRFAYRKYFTHMIKQEKLVAKGFWNTRTFFANVRKFSDKDQKVIFKQIKVAVKDAGNEKEQDRRLRKLRGMQEAWSKLTSAQIHEQASNYLGEINKIYKEKFDHSKYTL